MGGGAARVSGSRRKVNFVVVVGFRSISFVASRGCDEKVCFRVKWNSIEADRSIDAGTVALEIVN